MTIVTILRFHSGTHTHTHNQTSLRFQRVFKILRKSFGSCIPARKSKGIEAATDDVVHPEATAPVDDEVKDRDDVEEKAAPDAAESAPAEPVDAPDDEDTPVTTPTADDAGAEEEGSPMVEERDGSPEDPVAEKAEAATREVEDDETKPTTTEVEATEQSEDYQWELSCCGVDIPLSK